MEWKWVGRGLEKGKKNANTKKFFLAFVGLYLEEISSSYVGCLLSTKVVSTLCMKGY